MTDPLAEIKARRPPAHIPQGTYSLWHYIDWLIGGVEWLRGLLDRLEWAGSDYVNDNGSGTPICPVCKRWRPAGHNPGCWLAAAIRPTRPQNENDPSHPGG